MSGLVTADRRGAGTRLDPKATVGPVVVWVDGPRVSAAASEARPVLSQRNVQFSSPLLVVRAGQTVDMPNEDDVAHNVYSQSPAKQFNLGIYARGQTKAVTFDQAGMIDVRCSIHRRMTSKILVVSNPYHAMTTVGGRYRITGLPAGQYSLHAWSKGFPETQQEIAVSADGDVTLDLALAQPQ